jgi:glycosyltransferase involved in cell wall biosynthesis/GT2 family glycosyltransferase
MPVYVLVTAARDEAEHIERTIRSVIAQTVLPERWIIVSDGSKDRTDEIVTSYARQHDFIKLVRLENTRQRDFASKVYAQQEGIRHINGIAYDFFGFLDADVSFEPDAMQCVLTRFEANPHLGIAGGTVYERGNGQFRRISGHRSRSVGGVFQIFRRACLEQVNLVPLRYGGEDTIVECRAAMNGWLVESSSQPAIYHYKDPRTLRQKLKTSYIYGQRDYACRSHPVYVMAKCLRRLLEKPYILSSAARLAGYIRAFLSRYPREVPDDIADYIRKEQLQRLRGTAFRKPPQNQTKPYRVCIMAKYRYPMYSRLVQQARALAESGIHVDVVCLRTEGQPSVERLDRITVYRVCRERPRDGFLKYLWFTCCFMVFSFMKLQRLLLTQSPDVLVVHTLPEYMVLNGVIHKLLRKVIVLDAVDLSVEMFESKWGQSKLAFLKPFVRFSEKISCGLANHVITASPGFRDRLMQRGIKPDKITVVMNAADTNVFTFDEHRRYEVITQNARIFYHGTVAARFGLAEAIQAIGRIQDRIPETTLHIYGRHHSEYRATLEKLILELNLEDKVILGGLEPHERIRELIRSSDIGIVPYRNDDFMNIALSTKMFEYAASGIPIAASRLRSAESVFDDDCVSFVKPADPDDLADKIVELCLNPALRRKHVRAAFAANAKVAGPVMAKRFGDMIRRLLEEKKEGCP